MKISTKLLREALNACAPATNGRLSPILACVKLDATDGLLTIQASNFDVFIERTVECDGNLMPCAVSLKNLQTALTLDGGDTIEMNSGGNSLMLVGQSKGYLSIMPHTDFPAWPADEDAKPYGLNCEDLAEGLDSVAWAAMDGDARPTLAIVAVILTPKMIECVTYDGHVCCHFARPAMTCDGELSVPKDFAAPLASALREKEAVLSVGTNAAIVQHKRGRTRIKLSDQLFPNGWRKIMEMSKDLPWLELPVSELKNACAAAAAYNSGKVSPRLKVIWLPEGQVRFVVNGDSGNSYDRTIDHPDAAAGEAKSEFNANYLTHTLQKMDGPTVKWAPVTDSPNSFWIRGDLSVVINGLIPKENQTT